MTIDTGLPAPDEMPATAPDETLRPGPAPDETLRPVAETLRRATFDDDPEPPVAADTRAAGLRLARVHLRMGSLTLARAELESFAGSGTLDGSALLDLAEARWRTGDLAGAGEAANAAIGRGVEAPLAFVIAAEAAAALGRPAEARRLAGRARQGVGGGSLESLFAGMPRSTTWPPDPVPDADQLATADAVSIMPSRPRRSHPGQGRPGPDAGPASAAAAEAFAGGRAALAAGDVATAALRLGVAIRLEPAFAQGVLDAIGERASEPALALVAGDALRLLGREHEALAAFDVAQGRIAGPEPAEPDVPEPDADPD